MKLVITAVDTRDRSYLPDEIIELLMKDLLPGIGLTGESVKVQRESNEQPESKFSDWKSTVAWK